MVERDRPAIRGKTVDELEMARIEDERAIASVELRPIARRQRRYSGIEPQQVTLLRGGAVVRLPADRLVPGDLLLVEQGDIIPADCRLTEAFTLRVSNATVTGEPMPQARDAGSAEEEDLLRSRYVLLAGTSVVSGQGKAVVFATGPHTEFGKIAHLAQTAENVVSPLRRQLAFLSRLIAALAIGIGLVFFAIGAVIDVPFWQDFIFSIGIIVAMVPEGLLPTLTLALVLAAQRLARRNVLIRHLGSVETLGSATVICTDKSCKPRGRSAQIVRRLKGDAWYVIRARAVSGCHRCG